MQHRAGLGLLAAYEPELRSGDNGQGHALSRSAVGFAAVARLLPTYLRLILLQRLSRLVAGNSFKPKTARGTKVVGEGFTPPSSGGSTARSQSRKCCGCCG